MVGRDRRRSRQGSGDALLLVNGFGGTPLMELYLMYHAARDAARASAASRVRRSLVGSYVTSLEMAGCSITVSLLDDEIAALWDAPVHTAGAALGRVSYWAGAASGSS